jgi:septum site-determining protein MinD
MENSSEITNQNNAKVFGVIALKGGVGKTTVVANLGATIAQEFKKKVLLVDANFSTPHLGLHLGLVDPDHNLHDVINHKYSVYEAIYQHPLGFHILPGSISPVDCDHLILKEKLEPLRKIYDVILIDSSPSLNNEMFATMAASDDLVVVSTPDYPTLSSTLFAIKVAKKKNTNIRGIVLNKIRDKKFELSQRDIENASDIDVLATIPDHVNVQAALAEMVPMVSRSPRHEVSKEYKKLASVLMEIEQEGMLSKIKRKIKSKISHKK